MLEMRAECERCHVQLPPETNDAVICSYECTFCVTCADGMDYRCPNCNGLLRGRPPRE